ncbi:MAG: HpcH/HpaI aldolase/citrate lyase family protein [Actinomycetota bacterium]
MEPIVNRFKQRLAAPGVRYGLFVSMGDQVAAEIAAASDFDWLIVDTEHAPNDIRTTLTQLQAMQAYDTDLVVRPTEGNRAQIKRLLDIGAQTLLIPMVDTAEEATAMVACTRYPPNGLRGVASARAARWSRVDGYFASADDQVCVIAQIESREGMTNLDAICAVPGVDALFVGPSDLAADLGHLGDPGHPEVQDAVLTTLHRIRANGKPAGVYAATPDAADRYAEAGATLVIVGVDTAVLTNAFAALAARFQDD